MAGLVTQGRARVVSDEKLRLRRLLRRRPLLLSLGTLRRLDSLVLATHLLDLPGRSNAYAVGSSMRPGRVDILPRFAPIPAPERGAGCALAGGRGGEGAALLACASSAAVAAASSSAADASAAAAAPAASAFFACSAACCRATSSCLRTAASSTAATEARRLLLNCSATAPGAWPAAPARSAAARRSANVDDEVTTAEFFSSAAFCFFQNCAQEASFRVSARLALAHEKESANRAHLRFLGSRLLLEQTRLRSPGFLLVAGWSEAADNLLRIGAGLGCDLVR